MILADVIGAGAGLDHDFLRSVNVAGNIDILGDAEGGQVCLEVGEGVADVFLL